MSLNDFNKAATGAGGGRREGGAVCRHPDAAEPSELATGAADVKETCRLLNVWGKSPDGGFTNRQPNFYDSVGRCARGRRGWDRL